MNNNTISIFGDKTISIFRIDRLRFTKFLLELLFSVINSGQNKHYGNVRDTVYSGFGIGCIVRSNEIYI